MGCIGVVGRDSLLVTNEAGALPVNKKHIIDSTDEDTGEQELHGQDVAGELQQVP